MHFVSILYDFAAAFASLSNIGLQFSHGVHTLIYLFSLYLGFYAFSLSSHFPFCLRKHVVRVLFLSFPFLYIFT